MENDSTSVLVVGGSLVGLSAALFLAGWACRPCWLSDTLGVAASPRDRLHAEDAGASSSGRIGIARSAGSGRLPAAAGSD